MFRKKQEKSTYVPACDSCRELKLQEAERAENVSMAVHQLRSPLASIRLAHQSLMQDKSHNLTKEQIHLLEQAESRAGRMYDLMNDLLEIARPSEPLPSKLIVPGSVEGLLNDVIEKLDVQFKQREQVVIEEFDTELRLVPFDRELLQDAVTNILDNAIKYTPKKGTITVSTRYHQHDMQISIKDNGIGVADEDVENLFKKFSRMNNAIEIDSEGLGLGLYIALKAIEKHKGTIRYEHNGTQGSIFTITLPLSV